MKVALFFAAIMCLSKITSAKVYTCNYEQTEIDIDINIEKESVNIRFPAGFSEWFYLTSNDRIEAYLGYDSLGEQGLLVPRVSNAIKNLKYYHEDFFPSEEDLSLTKTGENRKNTFCFGNGCDRSKETEGTQSIEVQGKKFFYRYLGDQFHLANFMSGGILMGYNISLSFDNNRKPENLNIEVTSTYVVSTNDYVRANDTIILSSFDCRF